MPAKSETLIHPNFPIQGVPRRSKLFQAIFRKKRLFIFGASQPAAGQAWSRLVQPSPAKSNTLGKKLVL
jgi:hypothetical protein